MKYDIFNYIKLKVEQKTLFICREKEKQIPVVILGGFFSGSLKFVLTGLHVGKTWSGLI